MYEIDGAKLWISGEKIKNLNGIEFNAEIKEITALQCSLISLDGIQRYTDMQSVVLLHLRSLSDISALADCADTLRLLEIEACPRLTDFSVLHQFKNLEHLNLMGSNILPNLKFLEQMPKLKTFVWSMPVADCDLTPCLKLPYASYTRGKRGYNIKDRDLPHMLPTEPFTLK